MGVCVCVCACVPGELQRMCSGTSVLKAWRLSWGNMCLGTLSSLDFDNHLLMVSYTEQARIRKHSTSESLVGSL